MARSHTPTKIQRNLTSMWNEKRDRHSHATTYSTPWPNMTMTFSPTRIDVHVNWNCYISTIWRAIVFKSSTRSQLYSLSERPFHFTMSFWTFCGLPTQRVLLAKISSIFLWGVLHCDGRHNISFRTEWSIGFQIASMNAWVYLHLWRTLNPNGHFAHF